MALSPKRATTPHDAALLACRPYRNHPAKFALWHGEQKVTVHCTIGTGTQYSLVVVLQRVDDPIDVYQYKSPAWCEPPVPPSGRPTESNHAHAVKWLANLLDLMSTSEVDGRTHCTIHTVAHKEAI